MFSAVKIARKNIITEVENIKTPIKASFLSHQKDFLPRKRKKFHKNIKMKKLIELTEKETDAIRRHTSALENLAETKKSKTKSVKKNFKSNCKNLLLVLSIRYKTQFELFCFFYSSYFIFS